MAHKDIVTLETVNESNMGEIGSLKCSDEQVMYTNSPLWALLQTVFGERKQLRTTYAICADDVIIGMLTIENFPQEYRFTDMLIDVSQQGKGYAADAVRAAIQICISEHNHSKIVVHMSPENGASQGLAKKCGFVGMGIHDVGYGTYAVFEYAILAENYENFVTDIRPITSETRPLVTEFIDKHWFGTDMLIRGEVIDMTTVDGYALLENGALTGVVTYIVRNDVCEITSFDSTLWGRGVGTALINAVILRARELGCKLLQLMTTNDNLNAIGFYQKRGFELVGVNLGAIDREREQKPSIPLIGQNGIPMHHEVEFAMLLTDKR